MIRKGFYSRVAGTFAAPIKLTRRAKHWQDAIVVFVLAPAAFQSCSIIADALGLLFSLVTHKELFASSDHGDDKEAHWPIGIDFGICWSSRRWSRWSGKSL
ncbi:hypothetical protein [Bradyrhizobium sp. USDA 329]|uniref:hypothetical protein n=1 Tax=unclassified Bradyrhizobium TaxID=2631580 RepID=UPI0035130A62